MPRPHPDGRSLLHLLRSRRRRRKEARERELWQAIIGVLSSPSSTAEEDA